MRADMFRDCSLSAFALRLTLLRKSVTDVPLSTGHKPRQRSKYSDAATDSPTKRSSFESSHRQLLLSLPNPPNRPWVPRSLLFSGYRKFFPRKQSGWKVNLTTDPILVPSLRMSGAMSPLLHIPSCRLLGLYFTWTLFFNRSHQNTDWELSLKVWWLGNTIFR
jgi:hypothetical protein